MSVASCVCTYVCILLSVAFYTLLEQKGLSYMQIRKGPNKVGFAGLPQPLADATKLLTKEVVEPTAANVSVFLLAPVMSLFLAFMLWQLYPSVFSTSYFKWGFLYFMCVSSLNVYGTLMAGWASNSKYALLGGLRAVAQTISYEVSMALIFLFPLFLCGSFNLMEVMEGQYYIPFLFLMVPVTLIWFATCVAETNRAPFDFAEGESELVSGFNVEYGAVGFAMIILAEYANILFLSLLTSALFLGGGGLLKAGLDVLMVVVTLVFAFLFVWLRASYPRFRYDLLMGLTWKVYLPASLCLLLFLLTVLFLI